MPTYVTIKNERIDRVQCSSDEYEVPPGWIVVPNNFNGAPGDHIDWFTEDMIRIPDDKLIEMGKRFDKRGLWYSKTAIGRVWDIWRLDMDPGSDWTNLHPLDDEIFQKFDEASGQWVIDIKNKSALVNMSLMGHLDPYNKIELPEFIYHYTSLDNFIKILDSKTFFMFSIYQMNDYKEKFAIIDAYNRVMSHKKSIIPSYYLKKSGEILNAKFDFGHTYISCFSELRDSLSQWRAYGDDGNGICLVINPKNLEINYSLPSHNAYTEKCVSFHNVIYSNEQQDKIIEEILDYAFLLSNSNEKYKAESFAEHINMLIARFAPIFKIKEFQEEREWRIIYDTMLAEKDSLGVLTLDSRHDIGFINTRNNLRSYFPLQIDNRKFMDSITGIILGPKNLVPYPYKEISILLNQKGYHNIDIRKSKISYR